MDTVVDELFDILKLGDTQKLLDRLKYYVTRGFVVNNTNKFGNTLLHMACRNRDYKLVEILIDKYSARVDIKNADGRTPLHIAAIYGATDIAFYISQNGKARSNIADSGDIIAKIVNTNPRTLLIRDNDNKDPMEYYNMHSSLISNKTLQSRYKNYKIQSTFFDMIKNNNPLDEYKLSMEIFFNMKSSI